MTNLSFVSGAFCTAFTLLFLMLAHENAHPFPPLPYSSRNAQTPLRYLPRCETADIQRIPARQMVAHHLPCATDPSSADKLWRNGRHPESISKPREAIQWHSPGLGAQPPL
ncbi:hypothetical protein C8Q78DRAFT_1001246 [Trametes maxima]|nr:hypothetical protein C8Q78DRAFT_1001246 [Trametes maxima]